MSYPYLALSLWVLAATIFLPAAAAEPLSAASAWWPGAGCLAGGVLLAAGARGRADSRAWSPICLTLLLPLLMASTLLDPLGRWACLGAGVALLGRVAAGSRRVAAGSAEGVLGAALVLLLCSAATPFYHAAAARLVGWTPLATLVQVLAALAGWDARAEGSALILRDADTVFQHALVPQGLLPLPLAALALGAALHALLRREEEPAARVRLALALLVGTALYAGARMLLLVRLTVEGLGADLFWSPAVLALSTLAAVPVLAALGGSWRGQSKSKPVFVRPSSHEPQADGPRAQRAPSRLLRPAALLVLATTTAASLWAWSAAGTPKGGRLLIDESHSEWSRSGRPFDTNWFGMEATYNYASFAEYLTHFFSVRVHESGPLTEERLATCDVLLLKMPTRPLDAAERKAVEAFVRRGGGLWLIGDHTNVFGSATHLNAVSVPMGIRFRPDATWDLTTGGPALWQPASDRPRHPVARGIRRFEFQTGCSLALAPGATPVMVAPEIISRPADYGTPNYFPQARPNNFGGVFGPACLAAAARHGAGRVVAFTDSTVFSTFSMFASGRPELAVNTVAWLNHRNRSPWPARLATLLAFIAALWLMAGARASGDETTRWAALSLVLTVALGGLAATRALAAAAPAPPVREGAPMRRVYFLATGSRALFENLDPLHWNVSDDPERERRFTTFLIGTQRFGLVPTVVREVPDYGPDGDLLVMALPEAPLPRGQSERLERFVREGGRLLLLPAPGADESALDALLRPLGMQCAGRVAGEAWMAVPEARLQVALRDAVALEGGEPLGRDATGTPLLSRASLGRGMAIVAGDGSLFANAVLGNHFDIPQSRSRDAMALQFWLFRDLLLSDRQVTRYFPERLGADTWAKLPLPALSERTEARR